MQNEWEEIFCSCLAATVENSGSGWKGLLSECEKSWERSGLLCLDSVSHKGTLLSFTGPRHPCLAEALITPPGSLELDKGLSLFPPSVSINQIQCSVRVSITYPSHQRADPMSGNREWVPKCPDRQFSAGWFRGMCSMLTFPTGNQTPVTQNNI